MKSLGIVVLAAIFGVAVIGCEDRRMEPAGENEAAPAPEIGIGGGEQTAEPVAPGGAMEAPEAAESPQPEGAAVKEEPVTSPPPELKEEARQ